MERLERVIVKDYKQDAKSHHDKLMQNHRVRKRIDEMQTIANKLVRLCQHGFERVLCVLPFETTRDKPTSC